MSPEAQQIAIAESLGYINVRRWSESCIASMGITAEGKYWGSLAVPDYLNDLNAMHEVERTLDENQYIEYTSFLFVSCDDWRGAATATAKQRAEAYLKTIGKWKGGSDEP